MKDIVSHLLFVESRSFIHTVFNPVNSTYRYVSFGTPEESKKILTSILQELEHYFRTLHCYSKMTQIEFYTDVSGYSIYSFAEKQFEEIHLFSFLPRSQMKKFYKFVITNRGRFLKYISFYKSKAEDLLNASNLKNMKYIKNPSQIKIEENTIKFTEPFEIQKYPIITNGGRIIFLTQLQSNLLLGFLKGLSYKEIEVEYGIKQKAAETYFRIIRTKTNYKNRQEILNAFISQNNWMQFEL
ncbi:MAG: hypothetical protein RLN62_07155 [Rickettsiales bacterium]